MGKEDIKKNPKAQNELTPKERIKLNEQKKADKRKWREERLLRQYEKRRKLEKQEEEKKLKLEKEEEQEQQIGRSYTVSIALPGSVLDNAQSPELRTYLAGQIARAAVVFNVDEIVIFNETGSTEKTTEGEYKGVGKHGHANVQLARILQYLECPQYLRKSFFPQHKDLQYAGLLNPLDCPHHVRAAEKVQYREGVVLNKPVKESKGSFVNVGLTLECQINKQLVPGVRVTVKMDHEYNGKKKCKGVVVSPSEPRVKAGLYWGYSVRLACSLGAVFTECPYKEMYDLTIGTSEKGTDVTEFSTGPFKHALVMFGGLKGLEASLESDEQLEVDDPSLLFQHYLNTCPGQGSRTIRTEEAILISMARLSPIFTSSQPKQSSS